MASPPGAAASGDGPNLNNNNNSQQGVRKCGYLRKQRHGHKRFFVLRAPVADGGGGAHDAGGAHGGGGGGGGGGLGGVPRLEYYESEKKWRSKAAAPKRVIALDCCLNVHKRADAKHKYLIALYTRDEYFAVAADSEQEQDGWYRALAQLLGEARAQAAPRRPPGSGSAPLPGPGSAAPDDEDDDNDSGALAYREVWQVTLKPRGLGQSRQLAGVHRLCLSARAVGLVRLNCERPAVWLQLMSIRRCGHSDSFFFMELGRSAATGPGELWMQADDAVVAQSIHETVLGAMRALKEPGEFRPRSKSQSAASRPISVPGARRHHHALHLPPSQTGLPPRRARTDCLAATPPAGLPGAPAGAPRARTASEGDGSPLSPGTARVHTLGRAHTLGCGRRCGSSPPPAPGPPRPPSSSASGSPSDAGFVSSQDEEACSPGALPPTAMTRTRTPDAGPGSATPPLPTAGYVSMERRGGRRVSASLSLSLSPADWEPRRPRTCSLSAPARQRPAPQPASASLDEHALLRAARAGRGSCPPGGPLPVPAPRLAYPEDYGNVEIGRGPPSRLTDDGYVPMSPGAALRAGDYVPMSPTSPTSVSAPRLILRPQSGPRPPWPGKAGSPQPEGSPDDGRYVRMWCGARLSGDAAGDYLAMSPGDAGTPPDPARAGAANDPYVLMSSPVGRIPEEETAPTPSPAARAPLPTGPRPARPTRLALHRPRTPPAEPRSPGEYINIAFGDTGPASSGSPASSLGSGTPGTSADGRLRSPLCDYANLEPGQPTLDSLLPPDTCPPLPPRAPIRPSDGEDDGDYTEMALGVAGPVRALPPGPAPVKRRSLKEQVSGVEAFLQAGLPDPHHGAKVIRADPQGGRRRHSSETFSSTTTVTPVSPSFAHTPKRHNSASVENVSLRKGGTCGDDPPASPRHPVPAGQRPWTQSGQPGALGGPPMRRETSTGFQHGLNYIAIDVREEATSHPSDKAAWARARGLVGAGGPAGGCGGPGGALPAGNAYASIDFLSHHLNEAAVVKE